MPQRPGRHRPRPVTHDARRGSSAQRGYGYQWQQARAAYLLEHPLCVMCRQEGWLTEATVVDHAIPHRGDPALFWDPANWQGLCAVCHNRKTATLDGGFGRVAQTALAAPGQLPVESRPGETARPLPGDPGPG